MIDYTLSCLCRPLQYCRRHCLLLYHYPRTYSKCTVIISYSSELVLEYREPTLATGCNRSYPFVPSTKREVRWESKHTKYCNTVQDCTVIQQCKSVRYPEVYGLCPSSKYLKSISHVSCTAPIQYLPNFSSRTHCTPDNHWPLHCPFYMLYSIQYAAKS